jgi:hypothetical protein
MGIGIVLLYPHPTQPILRSLILSQAAKEDGQTIISINEVSG